MVDSRLTFDEEKLLGHLRRLCRVARDFSIEVYGTFKAGRRQIQIRPSAYETYERDQLERVFDDVIDD